MRQGGLLADAALELFETLAQRGDLLEPIQTPRDLVELAEHLAQAPVDLRELTLEERDQLVELSARHSVSFTRALDGDSRVSDA
jgi:hypothetical protein